MIIYANLNLYIGGQIDTALLFDQATVMNVLNFKVCSLIYLLIILKYKLKRF